MQCSNRTRRERSGRWDARRRWRGVAATCRSSPLDLLAALALEAESRAAELLLEFGVSTARLREVMDSRVWEEPVELEAGASAGEPLPRSAALRLVLSEAMSQARALDRSREVGTEHLLAGLMAFPFPVAELLGSAGLELQSLRDRMTRATAVESGPIPMADDIPPLDLVEAGGGVDLARILDASANRAREGLRVVEDYVRFALDDPGLTRRLKEVRHRLAEAERGLDSCLLIDSRETREDVGTHIMVVSEQVRENPRAVLAANFKRIAEALRSLEEYSKLVDVWIAGRFEVLRYDVYTIEKLTMTAVAAHRSMGEARLMVLLGGLPTLGDLTWIAEEAIAGGADVIQYRDKGIPDRELLQQARELRIVTARARVPMIMNDRPDLARLAGCDGVHLGQDDVTIRDARRIVGASALIGVSTHDREQLDAAVLSSAPATWASRAGLPSSTKEFSSPKRGRPVVRPSGRRIPPACPGSRSAGSTRRERRARPGGGRSHDPLVSSAVVRARARALRPRPRAPDCTDSIPMLRSVARSMRGDG